MTFWTGHPKQTANAGISKWTMSTEKPQHSKGNHQQIEEDTICIKRKYL